MQIPKRRPGKYQPCQNDTNITAKRYAELEKQLDRLKKAQPALIKEVQHGASFGDFSENAGYQIAKGNLRALNQKMLEIEDMLKHANIINCDKSTNCIRLGHTVTLENNGKQITYQILGATESNPRKGIISHLSPLGSALMGKSVGDVVLIRDVEYKIINIK
jgi:transcription elongation factor GreA